MIVISPFGITTFVFAIIQSMPTNAPLMHSCDACVCTRVMECERWPRYERLNVRCTVLPSPSTPHTIKFTVRYYNVCDFVIIQSVPISSPLMQSFDACICTRIMECERRPRYERLNVRGTVLPSPSTPHTISFTVQHNNVNSISADKCFFDAEFWRTRLHAHNGMWAMATIWTTSLK